ncbi:MAG: YafY family protein [Anaerolineae bacterium]
MNRTDRLVAIILRLQAMGWQRAEDLSAHFEVSKRTIYRDMEALLESGVPVISEPGRGFCLTAEYFLPPLHLTAEEAVLLLLGAAWIQQTFDADYQRVAQNAVDKITTALPKGTQQHAAQLKANFAMVATQAQETDDLRTVRRAVIENRRLRLIYRSRPNQHDSPVPKAREIDPYLLVYVNNSWIVRGYCHLRQEVRHFRVERMEDIQLTAQRFIRQPDTMSHVVPHDLPVEVRVQFTPQVMRWVLEEPPFYQVAAEENANGLLVTLRVREEQDVLPWLLTWGAQAQVLAPESLRQRILDEARTILENARIPDSLLP